MKILIVLILFMLFLAFSCDMPAPGNDTISNVQESDYSVKRIFTAETEINFDSTKTYHYVASASVKPLKLLSQLERGKIKVKRAWMPLDDRCMNPIGPRFTVELTNPDNKIKKFHFIKGTGMLFCASVIDEYSKKEN